VARPLLSRVTWALFKFLVSFTNLKSETHNVRWYEKFGMNNLVDRTRVSWREGSPFTVEVVDPGTVIARGEGLVSGQAHHQAVFTVSSENDADNSFNVGDCRISIYGVYILLCTYDIHRVSKNVCHFYFLNTLEKHWPNWIIFGMQHKQETWCRPKWL